MLRYVEIIKLFVASKFFFRKSGEVYYAIARHYGADKKFYYHQQSVEYTNRKLIALGIIDPCQAFNNKSLAQTVIESGSKIDTMAGGDSYEPSFEPSGRNGSRDCTQLLVEVAK